MAVKRKSMNFIREIAEQAIETGCLSLDAEEKLRLMLRTKYSQEDFEAFIMLQQAVMVGQVKQESRELILYP